MDKQKKTQKAISKNVNKASTGKNKDKKKIDDTIINKKELKQSDSVNVVKDTSILVQTKSDILTEVDSWDTKVLDDIDKEFETHKAKIGTLMEEVDLQKVDSVIHQAGPSCVRDIVVSDAKTPWFVQHKYDDSDSNPEEEYNKFIKMLNIDSDMDFTKIVEINKDLFKLSNNYSLVHCVAEDLRATNGIAVTFRYLVCEANRGGHLSDIVFHT